MTSNAFKKLEGLHLPSLLQKMFAHLNLKDATIGSTQSHIDALITEQWVTFHLDVPDNKDFINQTAGIRQFCSFSAGGLAYSPVILSHVHSCRCKSSGGSRSAGHDATEDWPAKLGLLGRRKTFQVPVAIAKAEDVDRCTSVADWGRGSTSVDADPVWKQLQRKAEAPASAPMTQTLLSTGEVMDVSKQNDQGTKCSLTA